MRPLGRLVSLQALDATANGLQRVSGVESLLNLRTLILSDNRISMVPSLAALRALKVLDLARNRIRTLDGCAERLPASLATLRLEFNQIEAVSAHASGASRSPTPFLHRLPAHQPLRPTLWPALPADPGGLAAQADLPQHRLQPSRRDRSGQRHHAPPPPRLLASLPPHPRRCRHHARRALHCGQCPVSRRRRERGARPQARVDSTSAVPLLTCFLRRTSHPSC